MFPSFSASTFYPSYNVYGDNNNPEQALNYESQTNIPREKKYILAKSCSIPKGNCIKLVYLHPQFEKIAIAIKESNEVFAKILKSMIVSPLKELNPTERKKAVKDRRCAVLVFSDETLSQIQIHKHWLKKIVNAGALQLIYRKKGSSLNPEQKAKDLVDLNQSQYNKIFV